MISSKFIILTSGRSGSTYLQQLLNTDPAINCYDEIFNVVNKNKNSFYSFCHTHYPNISYFFLRGKLSGLSCNFPLSFLFRQYVELIFRNDRADKIGFKLIYHQLLHFHILASWLADNQIPIIHLQRKNLLKAAISHIQARATGVYITTSDSVVKHQKIKISPDAILHELQSLSEQKLKCQSLVHNNPSITIYYEDLFENLSSTIHQLTDFLQIRNISFQKPDIIKTNPERVSEMVENLEEIRQALRGTKWENLVD